MEVQDIFKYEGRLRMAGRDDLHARQGDQESHVDRPPSKFIPILHISAFYGS